MEGEYSVKYFIVICTMFLLCGCAQQTTQEVQGEHELATIEINIPSEITQRYGSLNIDYIAKNIQKSIQPNGAVSLVLNEQQLAQLSNKTEDFLEKYMESVQTNKSDSISNVTMTNNYSKWEIKLVDETILQQEGFELAEELLIKNILAYQLVNRELPELKIRYLSQDEKVLDEKVIRTKFAYSDE